MVQSFLNESYLKELNGFILYFLNYNLITYYIWFEGLVYSLTLVFKIFTFKNKKSIIL